MMKRIGLFGGSFDPVHLGHLLVAQAACEEIELDRLFFIPAAQSPFKPENVAAPGSVRLRLLRLALTGHEHFEIDGQELERGGLSFTIDSVRNYAARFPGAELFYLIGADNAADLPKWREAGQLAGLIQFVVIPRPNAPPGGLPPPFRGCSLKGFPTAISSSQVRARIQSGKTIRHLVPDAVLEALVTNHLYL